ncbi:MAG: (2Fe-2S) ferredoxin domain-containing protein [Deltaproteobacteria bacterium]|nr:(2Fe-2S) ferredoxin domain-containing protein [Deltaproteobacteria bacterium]
MPKLTIQDLQRMREQAKQTMNLRSQNARAKVTVHMGTCGISSGAREVMAALLAEIEGSGTTDVMVTTAGCAGLCSREPMATVELLGEAPVKYVDLTPAKMRKLFHLHVLGKKVVVEYALAVGSETTA